MPFLLLAFAFLIPALSVAQEATTLQGTVVVRESRTIGRDVADEVAGVFNAAGARRYRGDFRVDSGTEVASDLAVLGGTLTVAGRVAGRVAVINGDVVVLPGGRVEGTVTVIGGRVDVRDGGEIVGDMRAYRGAMEVEEEAERIIVHDETDDERWYRRRERWRDRSWGDLRLVSARTYNRVEGLPVLLGPSVGRDFGWGRLTVDALGIIRSADSFRWKSENVGHSLKVEMRIGDAGGVRLGGRLYDVVDAVEPWHLSDSEVGLASFLLHRDYRDYFDRHGGTVYGALFVGNSADLTIGYSDQRWGVRETRDPWSLFRDTQTWRTNPQLDAGRFHVLSAALRYDTRNDERDPWAGWYVTAEYEYGTGVISEYGAASDGVRRENVGGRTVYDRVLLDVRRYDRISPDGQLNFRLVLGGWLSGDDLPLQRRFSLGGAGTLPGYDFRRLLPGTDYLTCSGTAAAGIAPPYPPGVPAQCERIALAQVEYRGEIRIDPFGVFDEERVYRRFGWGRGAEWVVFADAGRGWLVGDRLGDLRYPASRFPSLGSFRADVGLGLRLDDLGIYLSKAVTDSDASLNFFVRLQPRF